MDSDTHRIQRVEFYCYEHSLHCPFCSRKVYNTDPTEDGIWMKPCEHTLFFADDNNLSYRSPRFDALMQIEGVKTKDINFGDGYTDGFTDKVCCPDSIKYAIYIPPGKGFGMYVGFAPEEEGQP